MAGRGTSWLARSDSHVDNVGDNVIDHGALVERSSDGQGGQKTSNEGGRTHLGEDFLEVR